MSELSKEVRKLLTDLYWAVEGSDEGYMQKGLLERTRKALGWPEPQPRKIDKVLVIKDD